MKANVGGADRVVRLVLGLALLILGIFIFSGAWRWVSIIVGALVLFTGLVSFCLLYPLFNINTAKKTADKPAETGS